MLLQVHLSKALSLSFISHFYKGMHISNEDYNSLDTVLLGADAFNHKCIKT